MLSSQVWNTPPPALSWPARVSFEGEVDSHGDSAIDEGGPHNAAVMLFCKVHP